jgi:hypothetical protein
MLALAGDVSGSACSISDAAKARTRELAARRASPASTAARRWSTRHGGGRPTPASTSSSAA